MAATCEVWRNGSERWLATRTIGSGQRYLPGTAIHTAWISPSPRVLIDAGAPKASQAQVAVEAMFSGPVSVEPQYFAREALPTL
jgi:hypothetical protein